jgi:glycosyltransferase involved in cell wall biosynthesis
LVQEHWRIRAALRSVPGDKVLVLEEARYPLPQLLKVRGGATEVCLFLHNAVEHHALERSLSARIKSNFASQMKNGVDFIAVHGARQRELVERTAETPVKSFALPGDSYLSEIASDNRTDLSAFFPALSETFVCLGEIRANKGIEVAIEAARHSGAELMVIGKAIDQLYLNVLREAATGASNIQIRDEFISAEVFDYVLTNCRALLLPYSQFDAQSGVLARAIPKQIRVIASDLPSLREQAAEANHVLFFETGSCAALAKVMSEVKRAPAGLQRTDRPPSVVSIPAWNEIAVAIQAGW